MPGNSEIVLDLPYPLSVNRTRRIDWSATAAIKRWLSHADKLVMAMGRNKPRQGLPGKFEATIVVSEDHGLADLDNGIKQIVDYARRIEMVRDDNPKYLRRLVVEFGQAPQGCRLILREVMG